MRKMVVKETFQMNSRCLFTISDHSIGLIDSDETYMLHQITFTSSTLAILYLSLPLFPVTTHSDLSFLHLFRFPSSPSFPR